MLIDLTGARILVTGASRGIGAAVARRLAASGARVGVHAGRRLEAARALADEIGAGARPLLADLADPAAASALVEEAALALGGLDAVVNNAGVARAAPLDGPEAEFVAGFEETLRVNLLAPAVICRAVLPRFRDQGGGRIVNIASRAAFRGDQPEYMAYAASKGGLVALTRSLARGWGAFGIKAFVVAPGFTRTEMAQDFIDAYGEAFALKDNALGRLTEADDVAPTVAFLLSGLADHATGTSIDVNAASYVR